MKPRPSQSPKTRARRRATLAATWADAAKRAKQAEITKRQMADPAVRKRVSERTRAAMANPEVKIRQAAALSAAWTPEKREAQRQLTIERMAAWRERRLKEARTVLDQLPQADREAALRALAESGRAP